ncbi:MAG: hypothetical protein AB7U76_25010 [Pirellulales bacterium]
MENETPGEVYHWLSRATVEELQSAKEKEMANPFWERHMPFVYCIDYELYRRKQAAAQLG